MTNKQIAERLFISHRTVGAHLEARHRLPGGAAGRPASGEVGLTCPQAANAQRARHCAMCPAAKVGREVPETSHRCARPRACVVSRARPSRRPAG
ncbi:LuxR C-terminal-related transcriptional regulator [Planotetraspora sp. A-T 1434]|nr:LuxR C-terminal-related transcriptional regulator [Planotetraspora sp. A-T 1434]